MSEGETKHSCLKELKECPCTGDLVPLVIGPFRVQLDDGEIVDLPTVIYSCRRCGLTIRGLDYTDAVVATHYELVNYTQAQRDDHWREKRRIFFDWILGLIDRHLGRDPEVVLDYGCSYGHLLDRFAERGAKKTIGIEVAPQLFQRLQSEGRHAVFRSLGELEIEPGSVDVVTGIDSFYLCTEDDPTDLFRQLAAFLRPGGILISRTTNRNLIYRLYALKHRLRHGGWGSPVALPLPIVGDARFGFSEQSLVPMLARAGLDRVATHRLERKRKTRKEAVRDLVARGLFSVTFGLLDICPGLVIVARKP